MGPPPKKGGGGGGGGGGGEAATMQKQLFVTYLLSFVTLSHYHLTSDWLGSQQKQNRAKLLEDQEKAIFNKKSRQ